MPQEIRLWRVLSGDALRPVERENLDLEARLESWLEKDISIISDDLMVIGRQVGTAYGGVIDLLCLDRFGDTVILELKRDRTPREIVAQALDYASWVRDLSHEAITQMADAHLSDRGPLGDAFEQRFGIGLPETLNTQHRMLIVASEVDASSERIISYLSETHGVDINAVSFQYFRDGDDQELLARVFLIDPDQVSAREQSSTGRKRRKQLTMAQLREMAVDNDVVAVYEALVARLTECFDRKATTQSALVCVINTDRSWTVFGLYPGQSNSERGVKFRAYVDRIAGYFQVGGQELRALFPSGSEETVAWHGTDQPAAVDGHFRTVDEVERFFTELNALRQAARSDSIPETRT
jgi:hypothetical protein